MLCSLLLSGVVEQADWRGGAVQDVCELSSSAAAGHDGVAALPAEAGACVHAALRWLRAAERCCDSCFSW